MSEVLAFELLARTFGASLERTELELAYTRGSKMTDFAIILFGGYPLGVSVTRAYKWHGTNSRSQSDHMHLNCRIHPPASSRQRRAAC